MQAHRAIVISDSPMQINADKYATVLGKGMAVQDSRGHASFAKGLDTIKEKSLKSFQLRSRPNGTAIPPCNKLQGFDVPVRFFFFFLLRVALQLQDMTLPSQTPAAPHDIVFQKLKCLLTRVKHTHTRTHARTHSLTHSHPTPTTCPLSVTLSTSHPQPSLYNIYQ